MMPSHWSHRRPRLQGSQFPQRRQSRRRRRLLLPLVRVVVPSVAVLMLSVAPAGAEDAQAGESLYQSTCANCHGREGQRRAMGRSRPIGDMNAAAVRETLLARRDGAGRKSMQDRIKSSLSNDDIAAVAAYLETLRAP